MIMNVTRSISRISLLLRPAKVLSFISTRKRGKIMEQIGYFKQFGSLPVLRKAEADRGSRLQNIAKL
jgi:hypothetical protein